MKARTYKKLLRLNQDEQERLRYLSKSTGLNQEQVLRKVLMDAPLLERPTADYIKMLHYRRISRIFLLFAEVEISAATLFCRTLPS